MSAYVANDRWQKLATPVRGFPRVAANLIFEILSPSTKRLDQKRKKWIYERNRVEEYVLVDHTLRTLVRFAIQGESYSAGESLEVADRFESLVLPGFAMPVADVFPAE